MSGGIPEPLPLFAEGLSVDLISCVAKAFGQTFDIAREPGRTRGPSCCKGMTDGIRSTAPPGNDRKKPPNALTATADGLSASQSVSRFIDTSLRHGDARDLVIVRIGLIEPPNARRRQNGSPEESSIDSK